MKLRNKKTGEIKDGVEISVWLHGEGTLKFISLTDLNEQWEDYKPKEPLIKNEKIRKAVRAWAEANSIKEVMYAERPDRSLCLLMDMGEDDYNIEFVGWIPTLTYCETYTIAELCGEKEE